MTPSVNVARARHKSKAISCTTCHIHTKRSAASPGVPNLIFRCFRESDEYRNVPKADLCHSAARNGNLDMLRWARRKGCPWDASTCSGAAGGGHLEVLQWARENGCPWNENTCLWASFNGHLEVLQWAKGNRCPWHKNICLAAAKSHPAIADWIRQYGARAGEARGTGKKGRRGRGGGDGRSGSTGPQN